VLFEKCSASAPSTLPSHASILTAKYPYNHGARANARYRLAKSNVTLAERLAEAGFATGAETSAMVLARRTQINQGFAHYRDVDAADAGVLVGVTGPPTRGASEITRRGIEFVRGHREQPFFLWLHYFDPHKPYLPPTEFLRRFSDSPYHGEVAYVDRQLGLLIDALASEGLAENTLVVLTSDHGEGLGDHGEDTHSAFVYESTMRVPLVFWGPRELASGHRVGAPVRSVDVAPTILDWLGLPPLADVDGASLLPLLRGYRAFTDRTAYGEALELGLRFGTSILRFVREGRWKYVHKVRPALYDLEADPGEQVDRASEEPERVEALRERLRELLADAAGTPEDAVVAIDARTAEQLVALGYAGSGPALAVDREIETLEVSGVDASDLVADMLLYNRAAGLVMDDRPADALEILDVMAERYPESSLILELRLEAHVTLGDADEAFALLRQGIALDPDNHRYWHNLFEIHLQRGEQAEALEALRGYHERWPCDMDERIRWANLTAKLVGRRAQLAILEQGLELCGPEPELQNDIAFVLATAADPELRDVPRAVSLAEQAAARLGDDAAVLDTLAAAYAADGRMEAAVATARRALAAARRAGYSEAATAVLREHAEKLERGEAIVE
jgi:arylsulfatase A-like enzyme/Flp pilus assembly protein TadD